MARTMVYRVSALAIYVVMKHSTIFIGIGDVDIRSFHPHGRDTSFSCLPGYLGDVDTRSFHRHGRDTGFPCLPGYLGDVDTRSFHRHSRDTGFPCLLRYNKQEMPQVVDLYFYKCFTYSFKSTTDKQTSNL